MKKQIINPQKHHAYKRYLAFNKEYPNIKKEYKRFDDFFFKEKAKSSNDGVYVSASEVLSDNDYIPNNFGQEIAILRTTQANPFQMTQNQLRTMRFLNGFNMFLAWRMSLSIYRIDEDIFDEMLKSKIPLDTPSDIFKRLPDFCVYVDFPRTVKLNDIDSSIPYPELKVKGFWAYLDRTVTSNDLELKFCADVVESEKYPDTLSNVSMVIKDGLTVKESADLVLEQYIGHTKKDAELLAESDKLVLFTYLPILLWLCAEEPDISNMIGEPLTTEQVKQPKYGQKKKSGQFIPPSNPRIYHLGSRLGGEIRKFKSDIKEGGTSKGTAKRPHIRKGHWHGYWTGTGQNKKFTVKWLPATFVNAPK